MGVLLSAFLSGLTLGTVGTAAAGTGVAAAAGVATLAGAVGGTMASSSHQQAKASKTMKSLIQMPESPALANAQETALAKTKLKRQAMARSRSVFSSPLGIAGEASTARKTLLGM